MVVVFFFAIGAILAIAKGIGDDIGAFKDRDRRDAEINDQLTDAQNEIFKEEKERKLTASRFISGGSFVNDLNSEVSSRLSIIRQRANRAFDDSDAQLGGVFSFFTRALSPIVSFTRDTKPDFFDLSTGKGNTKLVSSSLSDAGSSIDKSKQSGIEITQGTQPTNKLIKSMDGVDDIFRNNSSKFLHDTNKPIESGARSMPHFLNTKKFSTDITNKNKINPFAPDDSFKDD